MTQLRVTEIFYSIQGESKTVGVPTVFVRLTGCPLRCVYCDTAYAFTGGVEKSVTEIVQEVSVFNTDYVTVTGGEPLAQNACHDLLCELSEKNYRVSLETSGALDISKVDKRVFIVMDLKTPSSGEQARNLYRNLEFISSKDQVKFVINGERDYQWAKKTVSEREISARCEVLFSPSQGQQNPTELADKILRDQLPVRFQIQLHKILWGDVPGK